MQRRISHLSPQSMNLAARAAVIGALTLGCAANSEDTAPDAQVDAAVADRPEPLCWLGIESVYGQDKGIGFVSQRGVTAFTLVPRSESCHDQLIRFTTPQERNGMPAYTYPARVCLSGFGSEENCVNTQFVYVPGGSYDAGSFKSVFSVGPIRFADFQGLPDDWNAIDQRVYIEIINGHGNWHSIGEINVDWSTPSITNVSAAADSMNRLAVRFTTSEPVEWGLTIPGENLPREPGLTCTGQGSRCSSMGEVCILQSCLPQPWGGAVYTSGNHTVTIPFTTSRRGPFTGVLHARDFGGHEVTTEVGIQ
jgi:hypothetical protein